jgi:CheY-like chemotaxis protein
MDPRRVLVIDDEPLITQMLHRMLRRQFMVTVENDPSHAVARLAAGERFDLIICDLMMAPIDGLEVFRGVETHCPELVDHFLLMTGGASHPAVEKVLADWPRPVLLKPFSLVEIEQLLPRLLAPVTARRLAT